MTKTLPGIAVTLATLTILSGSAAFARDQVIDHRAPRTTTTTTPSPTQNTPPPAAAPTPPAAAASGTPVAGTSVAYRNKDGNIVLGRADGFGNIIPGSGAATPTGRPVIMRDHTKDTLVTRVERRIQSEIKLAEQGRQKAMSKSADAMKAWNTAQVALSYNPNDPQLKENARVAGLVAKFNQNKVAEWDEKKRKAQQDLVFVCQSDLSATGSQCK